MTQAPLMHFQYCVPTGMAEGNVMVMVTVAPAGIQMILKAGGVPVLAHPDLMGHDEYIEELVSYGLKGLEVYHTDHKEHVARRYEEIAGRLSLVVTGGSDCHGMGKGRILIGTTRVPYEIVERLRQEAESVRKEFGS